MADYNSTYTGIQIDAAVGLANGGTLTDVKYGTCTTPAGTAAKEVTLTGDAPWTLRVGCIVVVKFTNTNTASNCTLNVNGTGPKSIWYYNSVYTGSSNIACGYANVYQTYMYDGTCWVWISHGVDNNTTYIAATELPLAPGTAAVGTSAKYAREDHVHPAQTTITGNAGTATKLAAGKTISASGDATGTSGSFDGSGNVTIPLTLATVNSTTGSFGPTSDATIDFSESFNVPQVNVDGKGRVTNARNIKITMPDTKVNDNYVDNWYFLDPVNQLGKTSWEYTGWMIDRWKKTSGASVKIKLDGGGLISYDGANSDGAVMRQYTDEKSFFVGKQITASILFENAGVVSISENITSNNWRIVYSDDKQSNDAGLPHFRIDTVDSASPSTEFFTLRVPINEHVIAVKVELGNKQTLAKQDKSGKWVLTETPNKENEEIKCRKYMLPLNYASDSVGGCFGYGFLSSATEARIAIPTPSPMVNMLTVDFIEGNVASNFIVYTSAGTRLSVTGIAGYIYLPNAVIIRFIVSGGTANLGCYLRMSGSARPFIVENLDQIPSSLSEISSESAQDVIDMMESMEHIGNIGKEGLDLTMEKFEDTDDDLDKE